MLWEADNLLPIQFTGSLPPAPEIYSIYRNWRLIYQAIYQNLGLRPRIEVAREDITQVSILEFNDICSQYSTAINNWLNSAQFRKIELKLRTRIAPVAAITIIIQTDDLLVRRLAWNLWHFLDDYPFAEVAISAVEYQRPLMVSHQRDKIRILAVLGNSTGIDITKDRSLITALPHAEAVFLVEPSREQLDTQLWDDRGWNILFFAGHSFSIDQGETGKIAINPEQSLTIFQLKHALNQAISRGLQIAIFNSCDGLGLATNLADLNIPQIIFMREPVPDLVAQAFLKHFLSAFSSGKSIYLAVREARARLQGLEDKFPCASWLPVIYQNPAQLSLNWLELLDNNQDLCSSNSPSLLKEGIAKVTGKSVKSLWWVSCAIALLIIFIRALGFLQLWELSAYDQLLRLRPSELPDSRILIVKVVEEDIQKYTHPIPDNILNQLIEKLSQYQPRVIGLNIYRDSPVDPGREKFIQQLQHNPRLIAICKAKDNNNFQVSPPPNVPEERLGFDDIVPDIDNVLRRHLLFLHTKEKCVADIAFSVQLAAEYLLFENKELENLPNALVKLGEVIFPLLEPNSGGYHQLDSRGSQILLNYRATEKIAEEVTLTQVLKGEFEPNLVNKKIVIIGVDPTSDRREQITTPYSVAKLPYRDYSPLTIHAQMVSQILSAVLDNRPLLSVWSKWGEGFWIAVWSFLGFLIAWLVQGRIKFILALMGAIALLVYLCLILLIQGIWVPLIPAALVLILTSTGLFVITQRSP